MKSERAFFDDPEPNVDAPAVMEMADSFKPMATTRKGAFTPRLLIAGAFLLAAAAVAWLLTGNLVASLALGVAIGVLAFFSVRVCLQWERAVVVRAGKLHRVAGPGMFTAIPLVDSVAAVVDMRVRSTAFKAERVLTSDLVPVNVDAVLFWGVHDAERACTEVRNYERLVFWVAQTTLRDVMGSIAIAEMSTRRTQIDREVSQILEEKTSDWGVSITGVEIRDIIIPEELQDTLSVEAQAKQEYNARIILAEVEKEVADMFVDAAHTYRQEDAALQLRAMNFVYEGVKEKGGMVVVPSALSSAFENLNEFLPASKVK